MNATALALIVSVGCMFLSWRYFVAGEAAKAAVRGTVSQIAIIVVAWVVLFSAIALIARVMTGGF